MNRQFWLVTLLLAASPVWAQMAEPSSGPVDSRMQFPAPATGNPYSVELSSGERANYLRFGLTFSTAYSDNLLGGATPAGHPVSDVNYSVWPTIGVDQRTARLNWELTYAPGFTFYQRTSQMNQADHNALFRFEYRLSPHVTFSVRDTFQKSSNVFNSPNFTDAETVSGGAQGPNQSVIAPLADRLSNLGSVGLTYQYSANDMIGANGSFQNLYYSNMSQTTGLSNDSSQSGSAFYSHRIASRHYLGGLYQYQRLSAYLGGFSGQTETHAALGFYTVYPSAKFSMSFFGGSQYADTAQPPIPGLALSAYRSQTWNPAAGASLNWQGRFTAAALSYSHSIRSGSGLMSAVEFDEATAVARVQFSPALSASVSGLYGNNQMIGPSSYSGNGHTWSGTAAVQRRLGEHMGFELGYSRIHQTYGIPVIAATPNLNRVFASLSYTFSRPWGR